MNKSIGVVSHQTGKILLKYANFIDDGLVSRVDLKMVRSKLKLINVPEEMGGILILHRRKIRYTGMKMRLKRVYGV